MAAIPTIKTKIKSISLKNFCTINFFQSKAEEIMEDSIEGQRLRFLENEIHKTNLKLMEGNNALVSKCTLLCNAILQTS